jgi:hypothetical protein
MANQGPTVQELQELINQLQAQVTALENAAPAAPAAPAAAAAVPVVFADSPQTIGVDAIIDYSKKLGKDIYKKGCSALDNKALTDGFNMTPNKTGVFVEAFKRKAKSMGWSTGMKQITNFVNSSGVSINIIKNYGQIELATLETACERFCKMGEADAETRAKQNNTMMVNCLANLLSRQKFAYLPTAMNTPSMASNMPR